MLGSLKQAGSASRAGLVAKSLGKFDINKSIKNARVPGTFGTFYKHAVLASLIDALKKDATPLTFLNVLGGSAGHQVKMSHLNRDAIQLHRWLSLPLGLRSVPRDIAVLKPYLKQFEAANHNVELEADTGLPKTLFLPSENSIFYATMAAPDRAIIAETDPAGLPALEEIMGSDRRVVLHSDAARVDSEAFLKSVLPLKGRGLVWLDIGVSPSYQEQVRARNTVLAVLKRQPQATIAVAYPAKGGRMPWQLFDLLANSGYKTIHNCVHYADHTFVERAAAEAAASVKNTALQQELFALQGDAAVTASIPRIDALLAREHSAAAPPTLKQTKPEDNWEGVGIAVMNAPVGFENTMDAVGGALKEVLAKPNGYRHHRLAPLHAVEAREYGVSYTKLAYSTPGFPMPEDMLQVAPGKVQAAFDAHFTGDAINVVDHHDDSTAPRTLDDIADEAFSGKHISPASRALLQPDAERVAEIDAYVNAKETPMSRIIADLSVYRMAREAPRTYEQMNAKAKKIDKRMGKIPPTAHPSTRDDDKPKIEFRPRSWEK